MPRLPPVTIAFLPCSCRSMRSPQSKSLGPSPFIVEPKDFKEVHSAEIPRAPGYVPCHLDWREKSFLDPSRLLAMMGRRLPHLAYFAPLREHRILAALPKVLLIFRPQVVLPAPVRAGTFFRPGTRACRVPASVPDRRHEAPCSSPPNIRKLGPCP